MSRCYLITPPTQDVVPLEEGKLQLRLTVDTYDDLVKLAIAAAVGQLDPAAGGWLGRALRPATWELRLSGFPDHAIELPYPPLKSVESIIYVDSAGAEQTLSSPKYRVVGVDAFGKGYVYPTFGSVWPAARCDIETVRVRFLAGYTKPDGAAADPLPAPIRQACHLALRQLWSLEERSMFESQRSIEGVESKQWIVSDASARLIERATSALVEHYRIYT